MLMLKNLMAVTTTLAVAVAAQATTFTYNMTNLYNPDGVSPTAGELMGYFIPSRDDSGTLQTIDKLNLVDTLQNGNYDLVYAYSLSSAQSTGVNTKSRISGTFDAEVYPGCQLAGFVIVFNADMTQFFVTDEVLVEVSTIGMKDTFNFKMHSGAIWYSVNAGPPGWTGVEAGVSFDAGEHGHLASDDDAYQMVSIPSDIAPPEVVVDSGWRLTGWYSESDGAFFDGETIPVSIDTVSPFSGELHLTAVYEQVVETWTVTFDLCEHGTQTGGGGLTQTVTDGCAAVVPTVAANQGWEFMGWATVSGGPVVYGDGATIVPSADMTLCAVYKLYISVSQQTVMFGADRSSVSISVESGEEVGDWTATASENWLTVTKNGNSVRVAATENATTSIRTATIAVSTEDVLHTVTIIVRQRGAAFSLEISPSQTSFPSGGGSGNVAIQANCEWNAEAWDDETDNTCDWIVLSVDEGTGDGSFTFTVSANTSPRPRSATICVYGDGGDRSFTVLQSSGAVSPEACLSLSTYSMTLDGEEVGPFDVEISSTSFWTVESSDWIHTFWDSGAADDVLTFELEANYTGQIRTGEILFHWEGNPDQEFTKILTITQYPYGIDPPIGDMIVLSADSEVLTGENLGVVTFSVEHMGEMSWSIRECEDWMEIVNLHGVSEELGWAERLDDTQWISYRPKNTVQISVSENLTGTSRTGYVYVWDDIGNEAVFTIVQLPSATPPPAPPVPPALSETDATVGCMAGDYFLGVSCSTEWTVGNPNLDWLAVQQTVEGVEYSVSTNASTSPRYAEIVVRGAESTEAQVFTLMQEGSPLVLSLSASGAAINCAGAAGSIDVNCNGEWSAASAMPWVSIVCDTAASRIAYAVTSNTTYDARSAQISVTSGSLSVSFVIVQEPTPPGKVEFQCAGGYGDILGRLVGVTLNGNTSVTIPDGVIDIGEKVFRGLYVKSIVIPATVDVIGSMAFSECNALQEVLFAGNAPREVGSYAFKGVSGCRVFIDRSATGFDVDENGRWQGMTVVYYGNAVANGTITASADGGYVVTANDGKTLSASDFTFEAVVEGEVVDTSTGYDVILAQGGGSAVVRLKTPALGNSAAGDEMPDAADRSGALVAVEESRLATKPTPSGDEQIGALPVDAVPGLYYQAAWGNDLNGLTFGTKVQAKGESLYLGVIRQTGTSGFYKVTVSDR